MDPELQALRQARLAELKKGTSQGGSVAGRDRDGASSQAVGAAIAAFLEPRALERLSRVSLVRPERAAAVEQYLQKLISMGQVSHKIKEDEIVRILNGVAREENKKNDTKIVFNRRELEEDMMGNKTDQHADLDGDDEDDDFFD